MRIAVMATDDQWMELNSGNEQIDCFRINSIENIPGDVDAYLLLRDELPFDFNITSHPILINSVCQTLTDMDAPLNVIRINGWNGFLSRHTWEISGQINEAAERVFAALGKKPASLPDLAGFVSPRVIAMIINEAFFALEEKLSTRADIDTAMKLGTNYPYGPFEWADLIGGAKIVELLEHLSNDEKRYIPARLLKAAATV